jgi:MFS family permease
VPGDAARGRYRDALRRRDFRLLFASALVDGIGSWTYSVVIAVVVFDRTHSAFWLAAVSASRWVPGLLLSGYAGVLADRVERTRVMLVSAGLSTVTMAGLSVAVAVTAPVWVLLVGSTLAAVVAAPYLPAAGALTPEVVQERDLTAANALLASLDNVIVVVGPAIGGLVLLTGYPVIGLVVNTVSFLGAGALVLRLCVRSTGDVTGGERLLPLWLSGIRAIVEQRQARALVLLCGLDTAVYGASTVLYAPLSAHVGTGTNGYSYLLAANALGGVAAAALANRLAELRRLAPVIVGSLVVQAAPFALSATGHSPALVAGLQVVSGAGMVVVDVLALTALQRIISQGMLSRVLGAFFSATLGASLLGSVLTAVLLSATSLVTALVVVGVGCSLAALAGLPTLLAGDRDRAQIGDGIASRADVLGRLDLFAAAPRSVLERLAAAAAEETVAAGDVLIRQGAPADALWVLTEGTLAVSATVGSEDRRFPDVAAPAYVGELGLIRRIARTATVRAATDGRLLRIDGAEFLAAVESAPPSASFVQLTGARLARTAGQ